MPVTPTPPPTASPNTPGSAGLFAGYGEADHGKPTSLTRAEFDRVQLHPLLTEQMLRRSPGLEQLNQVAACHHERADGSGYAKGLTANHMTPAARILAAADRYQAMTEPRPHRPALSPSAAAAQLRRMATEGHVDPDAAGCVLARRRPPGKPCQGPSRRADCPRG